MCGITKAWAWDIWGKRLYSTRGLWRIKETKLWSWWLLGGIFGVICPWTSHIALERSWFILKYKLIPKDNTCDEMFTHCGLLVEQDTRQNWGHKFDICISVYIYKRECKMLQYHPVEKRSLTRWLRLWQSTWSVSTWRIRVTTWKIWGEM